MSNDEETMQALENPQIGDRYQEMYSWWLFVIAVDRTSVTTMSAGSPCTFPADGKIESYSRKDFIRKYVYKYDEGKRNAAMYLAGRGHDVAGWLDTQPDHINLFAEKDANEHV